MSVAGRRYWIALFVAAAACALDWLTKLRIQAVIPLYGRIEIIPGCFDLVHIRNRGAAFGFLNRADIEWQFWLFLAAGLLAAGVVFVLIRAAKPYETWLFVGLGLILGGAAGNLIDRIRFRAVVDFLDFFVGQWHWPAFNVADIAICCGAGLTGLSLWLYRKRT